MGPLQEPFTDRSLTCLSPSSHVLLLPYPAQGHINPLMQLGKRLASHGVQVTVAVLEHMHAKIVQAQKLVALSSNPLNHNFQILGIQDGLPQDFDRENWSDVDMIDVVDKTLVEGTLELVQALASQGHPVTCIVGDFFLRWTSSVAEKVEVPEFIFWPQCASVFSIYLHVDAILSSGYDPYERNVRVAALREAPMELIASIPGLPSSGIHPADLPFECPYGKFGLEWMRDLLNDRFNRMGEAYGVIANSFEALEPEVFKALEREFQEGKPHPKYNHCWPRSSMRLLGPLVPRGAVGEEAQEGLHVDEPFAGASLWKEEEEECKQWLDLQPAASVLFVAFGSLMPLSVAQLQELAFGLVASGQKCLWVIREKGILAAADLPALPTTKVQFASLEEALPEGFLEENQHLCKVVRWAPQALVLSHKAVGGFFSHCGWNSILESLCCGVPLLGWPWLMDQATNCWLASHVWKVGLTLQRDEDNQTSREYVEIGVRQLMEGTLANSLRGRAKELSALTRAAARRSDGCVVSLVEDIRKLARV